ncbi:hypothetical protein [Kordiimonas sp. SCSIO 12610]|uniref:DUF7683 domain-containing protein n=1 Tax=Kordiimonas sp. SCSIO 12610 TaxID=2829597 RepID=UPI0021095686|nr:hypothetical protein [Kordiimonas sp. SCSIO 12610]UTW53861.1 hypothetical protein KFF44_08365 [Kordiimonas sp. SCSIO 12610]
MKVEALKYEVKRYIAVFQKEEDCLVGEIVLNDPQLNMLQKIFNEPETNPMYDCWDINSREAKLLQKYNILEEELDFSKYEYFLYADRIN